MAYSSGFHATPEMTLVEAQRAKLDLICRKLGLEPGMRMLDIGSGWGSLTLHAAEHYGVHVTGVTLSSEQRDFVMKRASEKGLQDRVDVSLRHFRDLGAAGVTDGVIDAIASVEMGEHVGDESTSSSPSPSTGTCAPAAGCSSSRCLAATTDPATVRAAARSSRRTSPPTCT